MSLVSRKLFENLVRQKVFKRSFVAQTNANVLFIHKHLFSRDDKLRLIRNIHKHDGRQTHDSYFSSTNIKPHLLIFATVSGLLGTTWYFISEEKVAHCKEAEPQTIEAGKRNPKLPDYRRADILKRKTKESGIWVTFNDGVYDITDFIEGHPGGEKILLAAGGQLEPFWDMYAVHKNASVFELLEELRIGNIHPDDKAAMTVKRKKKDDPFAHDPHRHPALKVNSVKPFNAETPMALLVDHFLTPNELFFVRNHLPVPEVKEKDFKLEIACVGGKKPLKLSLKDLMNNFKPYTITATVQCAGNRRSHMAAVKPVKGLSWGPSAISNADWTGVRLVDVLERAGVKEDDYAHIIFQGLDKDIEGSHYEASIPIETALDPKREVLLAYHMNGKELPLDHGYPLRVVVPGSVGARQVKWVGKIVASPVESDSHWQKKDYKTFTPSTDYHTADFDKALPIQDYPVQSGICWPEQGATLQGDVEVTVKGYAWSGGGRGIIRVEVSADGGKTWHEANLHSSKQKLHRQWAWTLYDVTIPLPAGQSNVEIVCKAIDSSHNQQPETGDAIWNMRGLVHNAWHRVTVNVSSE